MGRSPGWRYLQKYSSVSRVLKTSASRLALLSFPLNRGADTILGECSCRHALQTQIYSAACVRHLRRLLRLHRTWLPSQHLKIHAAVLCAPAGLRKPNDSRVVGTAHHEVPRPRSVAGFGLPCSRCVGWPHAFAGMPDACRLAGRQAAVGGPAWLLPPQQPCMYLLQALLLHGGPDQPQLILSLFICR
jgi:hypothetical protein